MIKTDLRVLAEKHKQKLSKIKVFLTDVDGVLTDGRLFWDGQEVGFNRWFHALDGHGLKMLKHHGIKVGVVTGGNSLGVKKRCEDLKIDYVFLGNEDKRGAYLQIKKDTQARDEEILYIGDEFIDVPLLKRCGFSVTTSFASVEIQEMVDYVAQRDPGMGLVREIVDMVRYAQNILPRDLDFDKD